MTLEDILIDIINERPLGEFDGINCGPDDVTLYMHGPDAGVEGALKGYRKRQ